MSCPYIVRYLSFISTCLHRQALSAYPPASNEQFLVGEPTTGIRGISTHKVYPPPDLRRDAVRSYRTFSPLPEVHGFMVQLFSWSFSQSEKILTMKQSNHEAMPPRRLFSATLSVTNLRRYPPVRWCGCSALFGLSSPRSEFGTR